MTKIYRSLRTISTRRSCTDPHLKLDAAIRKATDRHLKKNCDESAVSRIALPKGCREKFRMFITNRKSANKVKTIRRHSVVSILTLGKSNRLDKDVVDKVPLAYSVIDAQDCSTLDNVHDMRTRVLPRARKFLQQWLKRGNVLIHCSRGVCRSALVVLDYLLNVEHTSIETAADLITEDRACVLPATTLLQTLFE